MINLAGKDSQCDAQVAGELALAGIEIVRNDKPCTGEVKTTITGKLGKFTFERFWYYWVVNGPMPLDVAERMYQDPIGKKFVRVAGHCGCPDPKGWVDYFDADGKKLIKSLSDSEKKLLPADFFDRYKESENPSEDAVAAFIYNYHIDTQEGLELFAKMVKTYTGCI